MNSLIKSFLILVATAFVATSALADGHEEPSLLTQHYTLKAKPGHYGQLMAALKAHTEWRKENGDPWAWELYSPQTGGRLDEVDIRSSGHHWADLDAYNGSEFQRNAGAHYLETVAPHVADIYTVIDAWDPEISAWPEGGPDYKLFDLSHYWLKPGHYQQWRAAVKKIHDILQAAEWPETYGFTRLVSGGSVPQVTLVLPRTSWADMEEPEPSAQDVTREALGEEESNKLWAAFIGAVAKTKTEVVQHRPELSVPAAE